MEKFVIGMNFLDYVLKSVFNFDFPFMKHYSFLPMIAQPIIRSKYVPVNFQTQSVKDDDIYENTGICPHYSIIENVAGFIAITPKELTKFQFFCGVFNKDREHSLDMMGERSIVLGQEQIPCRFCCVVDFILKSFLDVVKKPISHEEEITGMKKRVFNFKPTIKSIEMLEKQVVGLKDSIVIYEQARQILKFWLKKEGEGFNESIVISRAEVALINLELQLGKDLNPYDSRLEISCPQSPKYRGRY